jgi:hypothetical protein
MIHDMLETGALIELNQKEYPGCYLHRSDPTDVARTEHLTYVCTGERENAGPNNNWMAPAEAKTKVGALFTGAMQGRTMYVVPYIMGPVASPLSKIGVEGLALMGLGSIGASAVGVDRPSPRSSPRRRGWDIVSASATPSCRTKAS